MRLALPALVGLGRRTVTGMLMTSGQAFEDWSAAYRVFAGERFAPATLFGVVRSGVLAELAPGAPHTRRAPKTQVATR